MVLLMVSVPHAPGPIISFRVSALFLGFRSHSLMDDYNKPYHPMVLSRSVISLDTFRSFDPCRAKRER
jgi:hypothetical protein